MTGASVMTKTHLVNEAGETDMAVDTVGGSGDVGGRGETTLPEMGDDMPMEDVEVAEDDGEVEEEAEEEEDKEDEPKLPQEFYEVEAIRSKRIHKGKVQYLIKWHGWDESTNTWEPLKNLETIPTAIEAFEKSLRKASKKRKAKSGGSNSQLKKKKKKQQQRVTSKPRVEPNSGSVVEEKEYDPTLNEFMGTVVNSKGAEGGIGSEGDNGLLKANRKKFDKKRLRGAKRRKSGIVKRFIPDETPIKNNNNNQTTATEQNQATATDQSQATATDQNQTPATDQNQTPATEQNQTTVTEENQTPDLPKTEEEAVIMRIIKPVWFSSSITNNAQDALVIFLAKRSDGVEVTVDSKFLRVYNPNLLLDFYEQHIKYNP